MSLEISEAIKSFGEVMKEINYYKDNSRKISSNKRKEIRENIQDKALRFYEKFGGRRKYDEFASVLIEQYQKARGIDGTMAKSKEVFSR